MNKEEYQKHYSPDGEHIEYLREHPELNLTDDQQAKVKLLEALNKAMKHYEQEFYHHAERLRAALDSLKTIEMSKKTLFPEVSK